MIELQPLPDRIIRITAADLTWPFGNDGPSWSTRKRQAYPRTTKVDPFPCYPHDAAEVLAWAARTEARFPIPVQPLWYLTEFEDYGRTNGWADANTYTQKVGDNYQQRLDPFIVLVGKRIPPPPAMTRYLVGHEYGHVVQYHLERKFGQEENDAFEKEYAERRGIEFNSRYGGGRWHTNTGEIFANDFRILVADIGDDFWPHPGIAHPHECQPVIDWWAEQQRQAIEQPRPSAVDSRPTQ